MAKEGQDQGTRTKGMFSSSHIMNLGGGGGGGGAPCLPAAGYAAHYASSQQSVHGYPAPAPPPGAYSAGYGSTVYHHQSASGYQKPGYNHSPVPIVPAPAHNACPPNYGGHGSYGGYGSGHGKHQQSHSGYGGHGKHQQQQQQHVDYYHRHEETDTYQYANNNHGYGKQLFGRISRGISDAKV